MAGLTRRVVKQAASADAIRRYGRQDTAEHGQKMSAQTDSGYFVMSATPLVSVVMAVYNGAKYLGEAVESNRSQEFSDFEFIIVNDGSTDGTSEILRRHQALD